MLMTENRLCEELVSAYRRTHYRVADQGYAFTLLIDQPCLALQECMVRTQVSEAAYVTAWNPRSVPTSQEANDMAQRSLLAELATQDWPLLHGAGVDPDGHWPPEPSLLILGISREQASELGRSYGQNAIVAASVSDAATPRLVLLV
jgi:hypothetical protein